MSATKRRRDGAHGEVASNDEIWSFFSYQYIETGWFDYDREKTIEAMRKLAERMPEEVLYDLPPLVVFAPSTAKLGELKPFGLGDRMLLYLAPRLEKKSQREVDFTVAHEFAHAVLGHYKTGATTVPPALRTWPETGFEEISADPFLKAFRTSLDPDIPRARRLQALHACGPRSE